MSKTMFSRKKLLLATLSIFSIASLPLHAIALENNAEIHKEVVSTLQDQQAVAVTIYNNDLALVKDQRKLILKTGLNKLALRDVSA